MIQKRVEALRAVMQEKNWDACYVNDPINVRYLSDFTGGEAELVITGDKAVLITDSRYTIQAVEETKGVFEVATVGGGWKNIYDKVKTLIDESGAKNLTIEESYVSYKEYKFVEAALDGVTLMDLDGVIARLRQIKDAGELAVMEKAADIGDAAFAYVLQIIKPGMTENEVKNELEHKMKQLGASSTSFETIVASGVRSAMPHGTASEKIIEDGDIVTMDFGCVYEGYCSDMTRTFFVGDPSKRPETEKLTEIYHIVNTARQMAVDAARAGMTGAEVDAIARDYIKEKGYGQYFGHGTGHSVGLEIHEGPNVSPRNDQALPEGVVVTVEPGIYIESLGGVRVEDSVYLTKEGCRYLTNSPRELLIVDNR